MAHRTRRLSYAVPYPFPRGIDETTLELDCLLEIRRRPPLHRLFPGTNVEEARRIMKQSGLPIITADDLSDAAEKAVTALH